MRESHLLLLCRSPLSEHISAHEPRAELRPPGFRQTFCFCVAFRSVHTPLASSMDVLPPCMLRWWVQMGSIPATAMATPMPDTKGHVKKPCLETRDCHCRKQLAESACPT